MNLNRGLQDVYEELDTP